MSRTDTSNKRKRSLFWRQQQEQRQQQQQDNGEAREAFFENPNSRFPFSPPPAVSLTTSTTTSATTNTTTNTTRDVPQPDQNERDRNCTISKLGPLNDFVSHPVQDTPPRHKKNDNFSPGTGGGSGGVSLSWDPKTPDVHSTTKKGNLSSTPNRFYNSPGGFALQRMLDGCMSPHVIYKGGGRGIGGVPPVKSLRNTVMMDAVLYNGDENDDDGQCLDTNASSRGSDAVSLAPDLDDWKECFLKMPYFVATSGNNSSTSRSSGGSYSSDDEKHAFEMGNEQQQQQQCGNYSKLLRGEVGVWDWSLKCHVKFDCFPSNCIPGTSLGTCRRGKNCNHCLMELDFDHIEQMAMDMFMNPTMEKVQLQSTVVEGNSKYNDNVNDVFSSSSTTSSSILDRTKQEEELVLAQWKAALMYWQHPAIHSLLVPNVTKSNVPLNSFMLLSNSFMDSAPIRSSSNGSVFGSNSGGGGSLWNDHYFTRVNFSTNGQTNASSSVSSSILMHDNVSIPATAMNASSFLKGTTDSMFSLRRASVNKFSGGFTSYLGNGSNSLGGGGGSVMEDMNRHISPTTHASWLQRKYEWQECFRSLFIRWMRRIKELKPPEWNGNNYSQDASLSSRCCFFSISSDRTVLFRPFRDISNKTGCFHPMIVVSSSTKQVRSCLRAMGVTIKIMLSKSCDEEEIQYKDLTEEFIHEWIESKKNKNEEVDEDMKSAREELKALRDATAQGQTVGADISISMFKRTSKRDILSKDNASFPPLLIIGHDDCMAFFELFTNTVGTLDVTTEDDTFKDVPLLITRFQGLNQYMTLRRLDSSIVRFPDDKQSEESTAVNQLSFVELHGPILPCAFQDLISASASHFSLHKKHLGETNQGCSVKRSNFTVDENILGSHYFMMHLINHGEPDIQDSDLVRGSSASLGSSGSFNFNGIGETCDDNQSAEDSNAGHERGKTTSTVVWDTNRPFSIAYKTSSTKQL